MRDYTDRRDYFAILRIERTATDDEIKKAYRNLAKIYHPDKKNSPEEKAEAEKEFKKINEAYTCLKDPVARKKHLDELNKVQTNRRYAPPKREVKKDVNLDKDPIKNIERLSNLLSYMRQQYQCIIGVLDVFLLGIDHKDKHYVKFKHLHETLEIMLDFVRFSQMDAHIVQIDIDDFITRISEFSKYKQHKQRYDELYNKFVSSKNRIETILQQMSRVQFPIKTISPEELDSLCTIVNSITDFEIKEIYSLVEEMNLLADDIKSKTNSAELLDQENSEDIDWDFAANFIGYGYGIEPLIKELTHIIQTTDISRYLDEKPDLNKISLDIVDNLDEVTYMLGNIYRMDFSELYEENRNYSNLIAQLSVNANLLNKKLNEIGTKKKEVLAVKALREQSLEIAKDYFVSAYSALSEIEKIGQENIDFSTLTALQLWIKQIIKSMEIINKLPLLDTEKEKYKSHENQIASKLHIKQQSFIISYIDMQNETIKNTSTLKKIFSKEYRGKLNNMKEEAKCYLDNYLALRNITQAWNSTGDTDNAINEVKKAFMLF